jgi:hypothetical protein
MAPKTFPCIPRSGFGFSMKFCIENWKIKKTFLSSFVRGDPP